MHFVMDGYTDTPDLISDKDLIRTFLTECPDQIKMTKISEPQIITYKGPIPGDWGISGIVLIAESHISIHTFPDRLFFNIDIFSCKDFDVDLVIEQIQHNFSVNQMKTRILDRGIEYSDDKMAFEGIHHERVALRETRINNNEAI